MRFGSDGPDRRAKGDHHGVRNECLLGGRPGGDAEIREREGRRVADFRVAVDDSCRGSDGKRVDRTVWLTAFTFQGA